MTALLLEPVIGAEHAVASAHDARRRELRDRGHQLRAARRRSGLPRLEHASARSTFCPGHRRVVGAPSPQVGSGVYDTAAEADVWLSCLANGTTKQIADMEVGDEVLATDPETGESGAREVLATLPHTDQLLTLKTSSGEIVTTEDHRYWNATDHEWQESQNLDAGDRLLTCGATRSLRMWGSGSDSVGEHGVVLGELSVVVVVVQACVVLDAKEPSRDLWPESGRVLPELVRGTGVDGRERRGRGRSRPDGGAGGMPVV